MADVHSRLDDGFGRWDGRSSVVQEGSDLLPELLLVSLELGELLIQVLNNISQTADSLTLSLQEGSVGLKQHV